MDARHANEWMEEILNEEKMQSMSERNLMIFAMLLFGLDRYQLLERDIALIILGCLTVKMPKVRDSNVTKLGDGWWKSALKECCLYRKSAGPSTYLLDDKPLYQMDSSHEDFESSCGTHSTVKKGYLVKADGTTQFYAIKKIKFNACLPRVDELVEHETKYPLFLGRTGLFFEHNRHYRVVLDWIEGVALSDIDPEQLKLIPIKKRLQCLRYLFSEVMQFHGVFHVVGDIKPDNCILNLKQLQLLLIDFGGSHKVGSTKKYPYTAKYTDTSEGSLHYFASDVFQLGHVVLRLFPEGEDLLQYTGSELDKMSLFGLDFLISAMFEVNPQKRCTVYHADQFCELLMKAEKLDSELLEHYLALTINHAKMRVEDVVGLSLRPTLL